MATVIYLDQMRMSTRGSLRYGENGIHISKEVCRMLETCKFCGFVGEEKMVECHLEIKHRKMLRGRFPSDFLMGYKSGCDPSRTFEEVLPCPLCPFTSSFGFILNAHLYVEHGFDTTTDCPYCGFCDPEGNLTINHIRKWHKANLMFTCMCCNFTCQKEKTFNLHVTDKHSAIIHFSCSTCDIGFENLLDVINHQAHCKDLSPVVNPEKMSVNDLNGVLRESNEESPKTLFTCKFCDYSTNSSNQYISHVNQYHPIISYPCQYCGTSFPSQQSLYHHAQQCKMLSRSEFDSISFKLKNGQLPDFTVSASNRNSPIDSLRQVWSKPKKGACSQCPKLFTDPTKLRDYEKKHRSANRCPECDFTANCRIKLTQHLEKNHLAPIFCCPECDFTSTKKDELDDHTEKSHTFGCPKCSLRFYSLNSLSGHCCQVSPDAYKIRRKTLLSDKTPTSKPKVEDVSSGDFGCPKCGFATATQGSLNRHMEKVHDVAICYSCFQCCFSTNDRMTLHQHMTSVHSF